MDQAARYRLRCQAGISAGLWDDWTICIVAPRRYLANAAYAAGYDRSVAYEDIVAWLKSAGTADDRVNFRIEVLKQAIEQLESKDREEPLDVVALAKLRSQLQRRPAGTMGIVFARSGFTEPAKQLLRWMSPLQILLWESEELEAALRSGKMHDALKLKLRRAMEHGTPDFDVRERLLTESLT